MDRQRFLLPMLALITVWRLALLPTVELSPDEALALFYSKHHALWYLEMGPLTPWLIKISTFVFGSGELGVRLFAPLLALATSVFFWRLCRGLFDVTIAAWATLLLQVLPAFNVTALYMNSATVGLACVLGFIMALRAALHRASPWSRAWLGAAVFLLLAVLADWRNGVAWIGVVLALGGSERRRHHLGSFGFVIVTLALILGLGMMVTWNVRLAWPMLEAGELEPIWQFWPNYVRWLLLASPLFLAAFAWSARQSWLWRALLHHDAVIMLVVGGLYAFLDFGWGPRERWPHVGFFWWVLPAIALLAHQSIGTSASVRRKVLLRTSAVLLAAVQSMMLMRTDMLRSLGVNWPFQTQLRDSRTYRSFWRADPSGQMLGWREGAEVVAGIIKSTSSDKDQPWFLVASSWSVATELDAYLSSEVKVLQPTPDYPRVSVTLRTVRDQPLALFPRYDALTQKEQPFRGQRALFVSDDSAHQPPAEIRNSFDRVEPTSIVRIMHAGREVRTLKIFACHGYKPPDL